MKKILVSSIIALTVALVGAASANAAFTRNLTVGSTGTDVAELQTWLISKGFSIPSISSGAATTGYFGQQTKMAVAAYQTSVGLPNQGFFGPLTMAKIAMGGGAVVTVDPSTCPSWATCTAKPGTTPSTPSTPSNGALTGGAGDITVSEKSSGTEDEILEGDSDVKVLGFEVEADGSDIAVTSVRVEFDHTGSGSERLDRYVDEISIMYAGKVVGTANVDDFSENSDVYSRNISVNNAIVRDDKTGQFYVVISAVNNIDSDDIGENWVVGVGQIRFEDATGAILTDTTGDGVSGGDNGITETFSFEDLSSSGDIELSISEDDEDVNETHTVSVDDSSDTNDVDILSFALDAEGSDITVNTLSFGVTSNSGTGVTEIANDFRLMMGSEEVGTLTIDKDCDGGSDGFASSTDEAICVVVSDLDDDDVMIEAGKKVAFMLVADINDVDGGFSSGDDLSVTLNSDVTLSSNGHVDADDENGDALTISELSGSADSSTIDFLSSGITVSTTGKTATTDTKVSDVATDDEGNFTITFDVKAIEDDAFIELGSATRGTTESNTGANYVIQDEPNSYAATTTGTISLANLERVSGGTLSGEFVKITSGQTATFKLTVDFNAGQPTGTSIGYRLRLYSVNSAATAIDATDQQVLTPEVDYRTGVVSVGN